MDHVDGFGFPTFCTQRNEEFLRRINETDKVAFATATAINTLIPILISIQRLPTATIHELLLRGYGTIALVTAGLTFGLPVMQESSQSVVKPADFLREDSSPTAYDGNGFFQTRCTKLVFSSLFVLLQVVIVGVPAVLSHHTGPRPHNFDLWSCNPSTKAAWHIAFFTPVLAVGIVWYCFLRCTYRVYDDTRGDRQLIAYCRRNWVQPIAPIIEQLPVLAQMLMTIYFTFLLSTTYGESVRAALLRVILVALCIFLSRTASLWFARAASERDAKIIVRCENGVEVDKVLSSWGRRHDPQYHFLQHPFSPPLPLPSSAATESTVKSSLSARCTEISQDLPRHK